MRCNGPQDGTLFPTSDTAPRLPEQEGIMTIEETYRVMTDGREYRIQHYSRQWFRWRWRWIRQYRMEFSWIAEWSTYDEAKDAMDELIDVHKAEVRGWAKADVQIAYKE